MKIYKVGDKVKIKTKEQFIKYFKKHNLDYEENEKGEIENEKDFGPKLVFGMNKFFGKEAKVINIINDRENWVSIDIDSHYFSWFYEMFQNDSLSHKLKLIK